LAEQIDAVCTRLSTGLQASRQLAALSSTLLGKLDMRWERHRAILIAPDGPIWRAPVSLLRLPGSDKTLADVAPCFYVPSAGVLAQMRAQPRPDGTRLGLVVSHAADGPASLAGAEEEIRFVRGAMSHLADVAVLGRVDGATGPATPARVVELLGEATHVHFLAHAVGGAEDRESCILLSTTDGSGQALLTASQIEKLHLRAELVVLATCESSLGHSRPGEGLASLARAFLLAGARCVIATLWEVENRGAREFFRACYGFIASGDAPARAYRRARQHYEKQHGRDGVSTGVVVLGDADCDEDRQDLRYIQPHLERDS
jgi:CHAT domain-containing protein